MFHNEWKKTWEWKEKATEKLNETKLKKRRNTKWQRKNKVENIQKQKYKIAEANRNKAGQNYTCTFLILIWLAGWRMCSVDKCV